MPNYLKVPQKQRVLALLALGWSYRRIEAETGVAGKRSGVRPPAPGRCGQNVPRLRGLTAGGSEGTALVAAENPAKTCAGSDLPGFFGPVIIGEWRPSVPLLLVA